MKKDGKVYCQTEHALLWDPETRMNAMGLAFVEENISRGESRLSPDGRHMLFFATCKHCGREALIGSMKRTQ